jgi:hypothetical protein
MSAGAADQARGTSRRRVALQVVGFLVGLGVLAGCAYLAFSNPEHRAKLWRLTEAPWWQLAALLGLSMGTIVLPGLVFRSVIRPVRRLRAMDAVAVNGVCSALSYMPFKMSLVFRVLYHRRVDGIPLAEIGGWMAATAGIILVSLGPPAAASLARGKMDAWWWVIALGGLAAGGVVTLAVARWLSSDAGWAALTGLARATRLKIAERVVESERFEQVHRGVVMLADARAVWGTLGLRVLDMSVQAARFYVAAMAVGVEMTPGQAVIAGVMFFFLQAAAPTGVAGVREGGTAAVLGLLNLPEGVLVVVLTVAAAEAVMNVVMGLGGAAYLRVDRVFVAGGGHRATLVGSSDAAGACADQPDHRRPDGER